MKKSLYLLLLVLYKFLIFRLSSHPIPSNIDIGRIDKLLHILEYLPLGLLWSIFLKEFRIKHIFILSFIFSLLYAISDEIHQAFVPGRYSTLGDLMADSIGIIIGIYIIKKWHR